MVLVETLKVSFVKPKAGGIMKFKLSLAVLCLALGSLAEAKVDVWNNPAGAIQNGPTTTGWVTVMEVPVTVDRVSDILVTTLTEIFLQSCTSSQCGGPYAQGGMIRVTLRTAAGGGVPGAFSATRFRDSQMGGSSNESNTQNTEFPVTLSVGANAVAAGNYKVVFELYNMGATVPVFRYLVRQATVLATPR